MNEPCITCARPRGIATDDPGNPPVDLGRCLRTDGLECRAVAQAKRMTRTNLVWSAVFAREYDRHAGLIATAKMLTPLTDEERARCVKYARARADEVVRAMESTEGANEDQ